ncbi:MAG: hypothetical protein AAFR31_02155 [Cyanobacteria bacterium J06627_8]
MIDSNTRLINSTDDVLLSGNNTAIASAASANIVAVPTSTSTTSSMLDASDPELHSIDHLHEDDHLTGDTVVFSRDTRRTRATLSSQATIRGTRRSDRLRGTNRADTLRGLNGNDILIGRGKQDQLIGGRGNDRLKGGSGNDRLVGGSGRDRLIGGGGRDRLDGGKGKDIYQGGNGNDTIITRLGDGHSTLGKADVVKRFQNGRDTIELEDISVNALIIRQGTGQRSNDTIIQHQGTGEYLLILENIDSTTINADDFAAQATEPNPNPASPNPNPASRSRSSFADSTVRFSNSASETDIASLGGSTLTIGSRSIYIGYRQVSSNNQDPIIVSFDSQNPNNNWVKTDYEMTGADSRGYGLFWSGQDLYAVFSTDGTQGTPSEDFRRASQDATQSWLKSYGSGGGAKISVLARIDPSTGELLDAVYLSAILNSGKSNTLVVEDVSLNAAGNLVVQAQSWFGPRNPNGTRMTQIGSGSSPFDYTVELTPDLKRVVSTAADGWQ